MSSGGGLVETKKCPDNQVWRRAPVSLHNYKYTKGTMTHNDLDELFAAHFDEWKDDDQYELNGLYFSVSEKDATSMRVHVFFKPNLLIHNLITSAVGSRLKMLQGAAEVDEYKVDAKDLYKPH